MRKPTVRHTITLRLHKACGVDITEISDTVTGEMSIRMGLYRLLEKAGLTQLLFENTSDIKPGFLLISNKQELISTGAIDQPIRSDMAVRLVPTTHGG